MIVASGRETEESDFVEDVDQAQCEPDLGCQCGRRAQAGPCSSQPPGLHGKRCDDVVRVCLIAHVADGPGERENLRALQIADKRYPGWIHIPGKRQGR